MKKESGPPSHLSKLRTLTLQSFSDGARTSNYAFIDSQNLNLGILELGWKLDFRRFRIYFKEKYAVTKAYLFLGYIPDNKNLYDSLNQAGYQLIFKPVVKDRKGKVKGNVDAELVLWAMIDYNRYQKAVIVTGDGDFYCLIDYLYKQGKLLKLLIPNADKYSRLLNFFAPNKLDFMNNLKNKLEYKRKPS